MKWCRYYHGEERPPENYTEVQRMFWDWELKYFQLPDHIRDRWENEMADLFDDFLILGDYIKIQPKVTRGLLAHSCGIAMDMSPMGMIERLTERVPQYDTELEHLHNIPKQNRWFVAVMLYYHGEDKCPYPLTDMRATYWALEQMWLTQVCNVNEPMEFTQMMEFMSDFPDRLDKITSATRTPESLTSFMYERYCNAGGSYEGFPAWLIAYVNSAK